MEVFCSFLDLAATGAGFSFLLMADSGSESVSKRKIACDFHIKTVFPERFVDLEVSDGIFSLNSKQE